MGVISKNIPYPIDPSRFNIESFYNLPDGGEDHARRILPPSRFSV